MVIEVEIMQGLYDLWISFKDSIDVDNNFRGRVYHNPTIASIDRVFRVVSKMPITIIRDGRSPIIIAHRLAAAKDALPSHNTEEPHT